MTDERFEKLREILDRRTFTIMWQGLTDEELTLYIMLCEEKFGFRPPQGLLMFLKKMNGYFSPKAYMVKYMVKTSFLHYPQEPRVKSPQTNGRVCIYGFEHKTDEFKKYHSLLSPRTLPKSFEEVKDYLLIIGEESQWVDYFSPKTRESNTVEDICFFYCYNFKNGAYEVYPNGFKKVWETYNSFAEMFIDIMMKFLEEAYELFPEYKGRFGITDSELKFWDKKNKKRKNNPKKSKYSDFFRKFCII